MITNKVSEVVHCSEEMFQNQIQTLRQRRQIIWKFFFGGIETDTKAFEVNGVKKVSVEVCRD